MRSVEPTGTVEEIESGMEVIHGTVNTAESGKQPNPKTKQKVQLKYMHLF